MNSRSDLDRTLDDFFRMGSDEVADRVIDAALLTIDHTPQRHARGGPWRSIAMSTSLKLATIAAAFVLAVGGAALILGRMSGSGVGGVASPSLSMGASAPLPSTNAATASPPSTASPSLDPLDTVSWTTYVSSRYRLSIAHPDGWTEDPADHDWTFENDVDAWKSTGVESFLNPQGDVRLSVWSVTVAPGTTVDEWMEAYCAGQSSGSCTGLLDRSVAVETKENQPGRLVYGPETDTLAFFLDRRTMYVVAVWRGETDPTVQRYGGARRLIEAFVSTLIFPLPPQASPGPS